MRFLLLIIILVYCLPSTAQDDENWRTIPSVTDWIEEINNWPDSTYNVENIKVVIDGEKDSLIAENYVISFRRDSVEEIALTITKPIEITGLIIDNAFGTANYAIKNIRFTEKVIIGDYQNLVLHMSNLIFEKGVSLLGQNRYSYFNFWNCEFHERIALFEFETSSSFVFRNCQIHDNFSVQRSPGKPDIRFENCDISRLMLPSSKINEIIIRDSRVDDIFLQGINIETTAQIITNEIKFIEISGAELPDMNTYLPFNQISRKVYVDPVSRSNPFGNKYLFNDTIDFELTEEYDMLIASYKLLLKGYQNRGNRESYGACFVEMKDLETKHLAYLHTKTPSFNSFFTWKINQFLKVFSAYGTQPSRAIIFSLYVILIFAAIYLFFPNHWDSHGKTRIMDRYRFFLKYLNRREGASEVYAEEKGKELMPFHEFREVLEREGKTAPKFFYATALPLYKWSISESRLSGWFLSKIDVLNGKWSEVPENGRWMKSTLVIGAFIITFMYDLFIKILNAVMLSINTFTTLGFGEIPIKGLPRYLAIIQGFIGWFMLTIFSVSLISQLLN